jgi:hypothetical protein
MAADQLRFHLLSQRSEKERMQMTAALIRGARQLSLMGLKHSWPELSAAELAANYPSGHVNASGFDAVRYHSLGCSEI